MYIPSNPCMNLSSNNFCVWETEESSFLLYILCLFNDRHLSFKIFRLLVSQVTSMKYWQLLQKSRYILRNLKLYSVKLNPVFHPSSHKNEEVVDSILARSSS